MKKTQPGSKYVFVDESGDPTFYDRKGNLIVGNEGCSRILLLGMVELNNPSLIRQSIIQKQNEIINDPFFASFPSIESTKKAFHANSDIPEIRYEFYKLIKTLDFKASFMVARKIERVFRRNFSSNESEFYDHLITQLFNSRLHSHEKIFIYFSKRGSRDRQKPIMDAINKSIRTFEEKWHTTITSSVEVQVQTPIGEPCLSIVDYMNWAVFRAYERNEMRYFNLVREKVSLLVDLYDISKYPKNWYHKKNPFDIKIITPL